MPRLLSLLLVTLTSITPFIPTIFVAVQRRFIPQIKDILKLKSFESALEKGFLHFVFDSQTILLLTIPIIAINSSFLLIFCDKFLAKQRLYSLRLRDYSCTIANVVFILQPSRIDTMRDASMASLLYMLSVCFCLIGAIIYLEFLSRKDFGYYSMVLCLSSCLLFIAGVVVDISSISLPIVVIAAVIFNQIKCASVGAYRFSYLISVVILVFTAGSVLDYSHASNLKSLFTREISFQQIFEQSVNAPQKFGSEAAKMMRYLLFNDPLSTASSAMTNLNHYFNIIAPFKLVIATTFFIILLLWEALRWRSISNFTFSCLAFIALIVGTCTPFTLGSSNDPFHVDILAVGMHSYLPSSFLSFCLGETELCL